MIRSLLPNLFSYQAFDQDVRGTPSGQPATPRRWYRRRAAQRAGAGLPAGDPIIDARGVERVRAVAQLRDTVRSHVQPGQANRADGLAPIAIVRCFAVFRRRNPQSHVLRRRR